MKIFIISMLFALSTIPVVLEAMPQKDLELKISSLSETGLINIELHNRSTDSLRIFLESNSWGGRRWKVLIIRDGGVNLCRPSGVAIFTRNIPEYTEIKKNSFLPKEIKLLSNDWECDLPLRDGFKKGDLVALIYDVPFSNESVDHRVWTGSVAVAAAISNNSGNPSSESEYQVKSR